MIYRMRILIVAVLLGSLAVHAAEPVKTPEKSTSPAANSKSAKPTKDGVRTLQWEELIPAGYRPDQIFKKFAERAGKLQDDDPRAKELQQELMTAWSEAPVVQALDGKVVKLPGYVIPLESDGKRVSEFLLVPYFGACIHVPPPPSNQIVYVKTGTAKTKMHDLYDTVMITGILRTTGTATALAAAGYTIEATKVESY
jgi:uncharacterized protein